MISSAVVPNSPLLTSQLLTILLYCLLNFSPISHFTDKETMSPRKRQNSIKVENHLITVLVLGCRFPIPITLSYFTLGFSYFSIILLPSFSLGFSYFPIIFPISHWAFPLFWSFSKLICFSEHKILITEVKKVQ